MARKLYVGNLSFEINNTTLEEMFTPFGVVRSAQIITDRETGRSKGFGFVEMSNDNDAQAAVNAMNGQQSGGRTLTVNEARPMENRAAPRNFSGQRRY